MSVFLGIPAGAQVSRSGFRPVAAVAGKSARIGADSGDVNGSITLDSLERAAHALDCRLVYALVPREPFDDLIERRALLLARQKLESTGHSMKLEAQGVDAADENEQLKALIRKLTERGSSELWED